MESGSGAKQLKYKHFSVVVKEVRADDPNVETITLANALLEILVKDPVCGRSDYSDLPGVRRDVHSSWRSFAEYPRRTNAVSTRVRHQSNTLNTANTEERRRRNYEARIQRDKLSLQRAAKRERVRAQQRERQRHQTLLDKLQHQTSEGDSILSNPGLIINSPKKGSPGKLSWKENSRDNMGHNKRQSDDSCKKSKWDGVSPKLLSRVQDRSNFDMTASNGGWVQTVLDEVVSTTSVHQADECDQETSGNFKCPTSSSKVSDLSYDKPLGVSNFTREREDNPVSSSSQDATEKSSFKLTPTDQNKSSVRTSCTITSTTAPEIADADSSTPNSSKRKTRNVKRVNYTEMLEDDFDQDAEQHPIRESVNSGRKIRPVKRTLEKAIVAASLKKSPRKKKSEVDKIKSVERDKVKKSKNIKKKSLAAAAPVVERPSNEAILSGHRHNRLIPNAHSAKTLGLSLPIHASGISQQHTFTCLNGESNVKLPTQNPLNSGSLTDGHVYLSNPFESNMSPRPTLACQSSLTPFQQQQHYVSLSGHNIPPNPVSVSLQNSGFTEFSSFSTVMQVPFLKPSSVANPHDAPSTRTNLQTPISRQFSSSVQSHSIDTLVYDMNQPATAPPNFLLEHLASTSAPSNKDPNSVRTSRRVITLKAAPHKQGLLHDNNARSPVVSRVSTNEHILPVRSERNVSTATSQHASNTLSGPTATMQQEKNLLNIQNKVTTQENICSLPQHYILTPAKNVGQSGSVVYSLSTASSKRDSKGNEQLHQCKRQSQFDVETMLNSIQKDLLGVNNIANSNNEIQKKILQTPETKYVQSQKITDSICTSTASGLFTQKASGLISNQLQSSQNMPQGAAFPHTSQSSELQVCSLNDQTMMRQTSRQGLQGNQAKFIGPPPPLIAVSDLYRFPPSVFFCGENQGSSPSVTYQDMRPSLAQQSKHATISAASTLHSPSFTAVQKSCIVNESTSQRSVVTVQPSTTGISQHEVSSSQYNSVQTQPAYAKPRHPDVPSHFYQTIPMQANSRGNQASMPKIPALIGHLKSSVSAGNDQKNRMPVPEFPHAFQNFLSNKPTTHTTMSPTNSTPQQGVAAGMIMGLKQQVPLPQQSRNQLEKHMLNALGIYRLPFPHRPNSRSVGTAARQNNFQKHRQTLASSSRAALLNQLTPAAFHEASPIDYSRPPLLRQQESDHTYVSRNRVVRCLPLQSNRLKVPSKTVQLASVSCPKKTGNIQSLSRSTGMQNLSKTEDQQGPHYIIPQRALDYSSNLLPSKLIEKHDMTLPNRSADLMTKKADITSSSVPTFQTYRLVKSASGTSQTTGLNLVKSTLLNALDISHNSLQDGQKQRTAPATLSTSSVNLSSITAVSGLAQNRLTTATSNTPRSAYDYPLTRSQIKQEFIMQSDQLESGSSGLLPQDLQKSQSSVGAGVSLCHVITVEKPSAVTSTLPSVLSHKNSCPDARLTALQTSKEVMNSHECIATNTSVTSTPSLVNSSSSLSLTEHINIKVEAHLSHGEKPELVSSSASVRDLTLPNISQASLLTEATHNPIKTSVISEPQTSSNSANLKSSFDKKQSLETRSVFQADRGSVTHASLQNSASTSQNTLIKAAVPSHLRIKQEIHSDIMVETFGDTSVPSPQPSGLNNALSSSKCDSLPASNKSAFMSDLRKSSVTAADSRGKLAVVSTEVPLPWHNVQSPSNSIGQPVVPADAGIRAKTTVTTTESTFSTCTVTSVSNTQSVISQAALSHRHYQSGSAHSSEGKGKSLPAQNQEAVQTKNRRIKVECVAVEDSTFGMPAMSLLGNTSVPECPPEVTQVMESPCPSTSAPVPETATATQMPPSSFNQIHDSSYDTESSRTKIAIIIPPLLATGSSNKQLATKTFAPKPYTITTDPLFAWHIDSSKHLDSFMFDDITNSPSQHCEQDIPAICSDNFYTNNIYTVTVSVPCTEGSSTLRCRSDTSSVDIGAVKVEPNTQPVLNQREVIDLCVSDNDEDDPVDVDVSFERNVCHDSIISMSQRAASFKPQEVSEISRAVLPTSESGNENSSVDVPPHPSDSQAYSVSMSSDHLEAIRSPSLIKTSASSSPVHSTSVAGQVIKSPFTGRKVVMSDEQMSFIRNRLSRIGADLSSITSSTEDVSASGNSVVSSVNLQTIPTTIEAGVSSTNAVTKTSQSEQTLLNIDSGLTDTLPELVQPTHTSISRSEKKEQKKLFSRLDVNTGDALSNRKQTRGIKIKKECIVDDGNDMDDTASPEISHLTSDVMKQVNPSRRTSERQPSDASSSSASSKNVNSPVLCTPAVSAALSFPFQKDQSASGSRSSLLSPPQSGGCVLASIANWTDTEVSEWLKNHQLDKICPNLSNLDGRGLQRMAFEHQRDPEMFYTRVRKTLGLTFFQTLVICRSMKELNDSGTDEF